MIKPSKPWPMPPRYEFRLTVGGVEYREWSPPPPAGCVRSKWERLDGETMMKLTAEELHALARAMEGNW